MDRRRFLQALGLGLAGGACAAGASPAAPPPPPPAGAATPPPPAARAAPTRVTVASGVIGLGNAPVLVAREKGYFAAEGIDLDWQLVQGGAAVAAGIASGDVQFGDGSAGDVVGLATRGMPVVAVIGITLKITLDVVVRKDYAAAKGVTPQSPLQERIAALKGARMGVSSIGGAPDRYGRWLMTKGGFTTDDVENIRVGNVPEIRTALRQGLIEGTLSGMPTGPQLEQEGLGIILIRNSDVPEWEQFPYALLYTTRTYAEQNPDVVARVARAVTRGARLFTDQPAEAIAVLREGFADVDPRIMAQSVEESKAAYSRDGRMTELQWQNAMKVLVGSGAIASPPDTREGGVWTNQYLP